MRDALMCERRPHSRASKLATVVVLVDGPYTLASTSDWSLSAAMAKAAIG